MRNAKNFHAKVWKVSQEYTTTWKINSSTFSLKQCTPNKLAQITVLEVTKMKQKSSMTDGVHKNEWYKCEKCEKMPTSSECACCHEIPVVKAFHLKFKARLSWNTAAPEFFAVEFNCVGNHSLEVFFSEIS